jgi:aminoglycoside phosphotransferase (APT) family kinase protein
MCDSTKNHQTTEIIQCLVRSAYPERRATSICELTEGFFNVAYRIILDDGSHSILKIAPPSSARIMPYERHIMKVEVMAMRLAAQHGRIPVPEVITYDDSLTLCPSAYFLMSEVAGRSLNSLRAQGEITDATHARIMHDLGAINRRVNAIVHRDFGYPGQVETLSQSWHQAFSTMLHMGIDACESFGVDLRMDRRRVEDALHADRAIFNQVSTASLVHWDLWDGNVFVSDGAISGIIDWERALWADPLMEVGFRSWNRHPSFFKGYGIGKLTAAQERRSLWYDIYTLVLTAPEPLARNYGNDDMYQWAVSELGKRLVAL